MSDVRFFIIVYLVVSDNRIRLILKLSEFACFILRPEQRRQENAFMDEL